MEKLAVSVKEAAQMLGISLNNMYALVRREDFPSIRVGGRFIIPIDSFRRWLDQAGKVQ